MKSFAIIGIGRFGESVAKTLAELGNEVMAIDKSPERIQEISEYVTHAVEADIMDETILKELGLRNFDVIIVSIGSDREASIMATLLAKEVGVKKVIAKAQDEIHGKVLKKVGADKVIFPERDMGTRLAHNLTSNNILDYIELSPDFSILEIKTLKSWVNKSLKDLQIRNEYGVNVIAIKDGKNINISPIADDIIRENDIIIIIGDAKAIKKVEEKAGK